MPFNFSFKGKLWHISGPRTTWPPELLAILPPPRPPGICGFGDWQCPRPYASHLCGCAPAKPTRRRKYPYWTVTSLWTHPIPILPTQQLHFWTPPRKLWHHATTGIIYPKRQWWVAVYHCLKGVDYALATEKQLGAVRAEVHKITRQSMKHREKAQPHPHCW